ncbi:MAG: hypothetical protein IJT16_07625 [Lachnospiraceae bacterium]|nr:hypothetical protein [Lachnospiraceae bacterium]
MTAVKEQFMQMLPQNLPGVPDAEVQYMINILVKWNKPEEQPKRTDIADSGLDFGSEITDENHDERMARAFALSEGIEIDEQAIKDLREASMI